MTLREGISLASLTTFRIGGAAAFVADCESTEDIETAITLAHDRGLPWYVLGGGSNLLAPDAGFEGVILHLQIPGITCEDFDDGALVTVGAGVSWDAFVEDVAEKGLWGVENLAGIPGSVGASPVQNIGAYGAEVSHTIHSVEVFDTSDQSLYELSNEDCAFKYRDSIFKRDASLIITHVTFALSKDAVPNISYADIAAQRDAGAVLDTPTQIAAVIRGIRSKKFPDLSKEGTAGSFFKNPTVTTEAFAELVIAYPEISGFQTPQGVKVSLAWILDKILDLRGFTMGPVRLFEQQPLVVVASAGATESAVDALANEVTARVLAATNILIEREVRSLP